MPWVGRWRLKYLSHGKTWYYKEKRFWLFEIMIIISGYICGHMCPDFHSVTVHLCIPYLHITTLQNQCLNALKHTLFPWPHIKEHIFDVFNMGHVNRNHSLWESTLKLCTFGVSGVYRYFCTFWQCGQGKLCEAVSRCCSRASWVEYLLWHFTHLRSTENVFFNHHMNILNTSNKAVDDINLLNKKRNHQFLGPGTCMHCLQCASRAPVCAVFLQLLHMWKWRSSPVDAGFLARVWLWAEGVRVLVYSQFKQRREHFSTEVAAVGQLLLVRSDVLQKLIQLLESLGAWL